MVQAGVQVTIQVYTPSLKIHLDVCVKKDFSIMVESGGVMKTLTKILVQN